MLTADATGMIGGLEEATRKLEDYSHKAEKLATPPAAAAGGPAAAPSGMGLGGAAAYGLAWGGAVMGGIKAAMSGALADLDKALSDPMGLIIGKLKMIPLLGDVLAAPVESAKGIFGVYKEGASHILELTKQSEQLGLSTLNLQAILALSGNHADEMSKSLFKLAHQLGEIRGGSDEARHKFERFGLDARKIAEGGLDRALPAIMDRMKELPDPTERAAMAFALGGKGAYQLVSALSKGSGTLEEFKNNLRMAGQEFTAFDAQKVKEAEVKMRQLEMTIKGAKMQVATGLAPVFAALGEQIPKMGADISGLTDWVFAFAQASAVSVGAFIDMLRQAGDGWDYVKIGAKLAGAGAVMMAKDAIDALNQLFDEGLRRAAGYMEQLAPEGSKVRAVLGTMGVDVGGMVESMWGKADETKENPLANLAEDMGDDAKGAMAALEAKIAARGPGVAVAIEDWFKELAAKIAKGRLEVKAATGEGLLDERLFKLATKLNEQKSPLEEFQSQMKDLDTVLAKGLISWEQYGVATEEAMTKLEQANKVTDQKGTAAMTEGSAAAMSAIAQFERAGAKDDTQTRMLDAMAEAKLQREELIRSGRDAADAWKRIQLRGV